jgi:hypothetical protein
MGRIPYATLKRFDLRLGTGVLACLALIAIIGGLIWLEM